jgi:hypothetical protein
MNIPLNKMLSMPILCHALKIDVLKMEHAFQTRYYEGDKVFYVYPLNWKGEEEFVDSNVDFWNAHWHFENEKFEHFLLGNPNFKFLPNCIFLWEDNHKLQIWLFYTQRVHHEDPKWHYSVDSIVFNASHALVELLIAMTDLNKSISTLQLCFEFSMFFP